MPLFRTHLRVLRAEFEWSQAKLAAQVGVTRQTINCIEKGRFHPNLRLAFKIARALVWYNRNQVAREKIERGENRIVEKETFPVNDHARRPIQRDIWEGALKAAARVEKKYGLDNLGPWDDFEWGMINGKLSALRWVLGDEWDMLDT